MKVAYGTYTGNGSTKTITGVGFQPSLVIVYSTNSQSDCLYKTSDMVSNESMGFRQDVGVFTDGITSLDVDGFHLGARNYGNNNGSAFVYIAVQDDGAGDFHCFTYTGDGQATHALTGFGFQPTFAVIKGNHAHTGAYRYSSVAGDSSSVFYGGYNNTGEIKSLGADGLTLGAGTEVNANTVVFYGFAFKAVTNKTVCLQYTGNGAARDITTVGFQPGWVWLKVKDGNNGPSTKSKSHAATASQPFDGGTNTTDIVAILSNGFSLGTTDTVNKSGSTYEAFILYDPATYPLGVTAHKSLVGVGI